MFLSSLEIHPSSIVTEIVAQDHRAANVFSKYEIEFCCGGKWTLEAICLMKGIEMNELLKELVFATRDLQLSAFLSFNEWDLDFLADYIINVHHYYLKKLLPEFKIQLEDFVEEHVKKDDGLHQLTYQFSELCNNLSPHMQEEETIIFPYIKQVAHAHKNKDSYASLLVRTLRKPVGRIMADEEEVILSIINNLRKLTNHYTAPEKACTNHRVIFSRLKELDNDLVQHIYLENGFLFPRALAMEKELLDRSV